MVTTCGVYTNSYHHKFTMVRGVPCSYAHGEGKSTWLITLVAKRRSLDVRALLEWETLVQSQALGNSEGGIANESTGQTLVIHLQNMERKE